MCWLSAQPGVQCHRFTLLARDSRGRRRKRVIVIVHNMPSWTFALLREWHLPDGNVWTDAIADDLPADLCEQLYSAVSTAIRSSTRKGLDLPVGPASHAQFVDELLDHLSVSELHELGGAWQDCATPGCGHVLSSFAAIPRSCAFSVARRYWMER